MSYIRIHNNIPSKLHLRYVFEFILVIYTALYS